MQILRRFYFHIWKLKEKFSIEIVKLTYQVRNYEIGITILYQIHIFLISKTNFVILPSK